MSSRIVFYVWVAPLLFVSMGSLCPAQGMEVSYAREHASFQSTNQYLQVLRLSAANQPDTALALCKEIIEKDPNFDRAYTQMVTLAKENHRLEEVAAYFAELRRKPRGNACIDYALGLIDKERGEHDRAIEHFKKSIQRTPPFTAVFARLIDTYKQIENLDEALKYLESLRKNHPKNPYIHFGLGYAYQQQRAWEKSLSHLNRALHGNAELVEAYFSKADIYRQTRRSKEGLQICKRALELAGRQKDTKSKARALYLQGVFHDQLGHNDEALESYRQALKMFQETGSQRGEGKALTGMGTAYYRLGNPYQAVEHMQRGLQIHRRVGDLMGEAGACNNLGVIHTEFGDYPKALEYYQRALKIYHQEDYKPGEGATLNNMGVIYNEKLNDPPKAMEYYRRALATYQEIKDRYGEGTALANIGIIYSSIGDSQRALEAQEQSLRTARAIGNRRGEVIALDNLADLYHRMGDYSKALAYGRDALQICQNTKDKMGQAMLSKMLGRIAFSQGDYETAVHHHERALRLATEINYRAGIWDVQSALAQALEKQGRLSEALRHYQSAIETIEGIRGQLQSSEDKARFLENKIQVYDRVCNLLRGLYQKSHQKEYAGEAFHYSERARARAFLDLLAEARPGFSRKVDPELLEKGRNILKNISRINVQLRSEDIPEDERIKLAADLRKAEDTYEQFKKEVKTTSPAYAHLQYPDPYTLDSVQKHLLKDNKTLILDYFLGEEGSYLWVLRKNDFEFYSLPKRREIEKLVSGFRQMLSSPSGKEALIDLSRKSYEALVSPAGPQLRGVERIIIIPDGMLYYLPFEALLQPVSRQPRPAGPRRDLRYLVEDYALSYAPSGSALGSMAEALAKRKKEAEKVLEAFANPVYGNSSDELPEKAVEITTDIYRRAGFRLPPLKYAMEETNRIGRLFPSPHTRLLLGEAAKESELKTEQSAQFKILHFATHALIDEDRPTRSALLLTPDRERQEDGFLQMREIFDLNLTADLVVLSSCQSALGKLVAGEGMVGITRAFMYAGAASVVASLWNINDRSSADFMDRFYYHLTRGLTKSQALRQAKLDMIESARYNHPYYWGSFVLVGEGDSAILRSPHERLKWALIILSGLAVVLFLIKVRLTYF